MKFIYNTDVHICLLAAKFLKAVTQFHLKGANSQEEITSGRKNYRKIWL